MTTRLLFLCTHNAARSQMAEALLRHMAGNRFEVESAGTAPTEVHPLAVAVMNEIGIDISDQRSKDVSEIEGHPDVVITLCDEARKHARSFPALLASCTGACRTLRRRKAMRRPRRPCSAGCAMTWRS